MKQFLLALFVATGGLAASTPKVEVNVVVDMTPEGRKVPSPTPSHPIYYLPIVAGYKELGASIAGEPPPPPPAEVAHLVALALAKAGYLVMNPKPYVNDQGEVTFADGVVVKVPAKPGRGEHAVFDLNNGVPLTLAMMSASTGPYSAHPSSESAFNDGRDTQRQRHAAFLQALRKGDPVHGPIIARLPTLILRIDYGMMNPVIMGEGAEKIIMNQSQMLGLVGGNTLDHLDLDFEREPVMQGIEEDRYFVAITAYDFEVYSQTRKKTMLWQAKMSVPDRRVDFHDVVATLTEAGSPYFGHEMTRPKQMLVPATPEGHVEVGTPVVKKDPTDQ